MLKFLEMGNKLISKLTQKDDENSQMLDLHQTDEKFTNQNSKEYTNEDVDWFIFKWSHREEFTN